MRGPVSGDVAEEMGDDALRQVIGLDDVVDRQFLEFRHEAPVPADHPLDEAFVAQVIEAFLAPVPLPRRIDEGQAARSAVDDEALLERNGDLLGDADGDESGGRHRVVVADELDRLGRRDDLALLGRAQEWQSRVLRHCFSPGPSD